MEIRRLEEQGMTRNVLVQRNTKETKITMSLNLDGTGKASLNTGIGFFDHMLDGFARHGFFDLDLAVDGDLNVDSHHTIEDTGIVLGTAIKEALGDKAGIRRYGSMILPMDETLVLCGIDLSGRPYLNFDGDIYRRTSWRYGYRDGQRVFLCGQLCSRHEPAHQGTGRNQQPPYHGSNVQSICESTGSGNTGG